MILRYVELDLALKRFGIGHAHRRPPTCLPVRVHNVSGHLAWSRSFNLADRNQAIDDYLFVRARLTPEKTTPFRAAPDEIYRVKSPWGRVFQTRKRLFHFEPDKL